MTFLSTTMLNLKPSFRAAVICLLGVVAVTSMEAASANQDKADRAIETIVETGERINGKRLTLVKLVDGTRCIIVTSLRSAAMDCDWAPQNTSAKTAPQSQSEPALDVDELLGQ